MRTFLAEARASKEDVGLVFQQHLLTAMPAREASPVGLKVSTITMQAARQEAFAEEVGSMASQEQVATD